MHMKNFLLVPVLVMVIGLQSASGQLEWHVTHTDRDWRHDFYFSALDCSGDTCIAAGQVMDYLKSRDYWMCWRSTNSGLTWNMQDPGLPYLRGQDLRSFRGVQQIDGLNAVAIADTSLMIRTFDGGKTWEKQNCKTKDFIDNVHFSDPLTGCFNTYTGIYTTTDGGRHWDSSQVNRGGIYAIHSYGGGKFKAFVLGNGPILQTSDTWKTLDSSKSLFDDSTYSSRKYFFDYCFFGRGDTVIIAGSDTGKSGGVIIRSTDGGNSWSDPSHYFGFWFNVRTMSSPDRDTIIGTGWTTNQIIISTNNGKSWAMDSLVLDTTFNVNYSPAIALASDGHFISVLDPFPSYVIPGLIARTGSVPSKVESDVNLSDKIFIYPNPASSKIHLLSRERSGVLEIVDPLSRSLLHHAIAENVELMLDISMLLPGAYTLILNHCAIGKFVVSGGEGR